MNTSELYDLLEKVGSDYSKSKISSLLDALHAAISAQISSPSDENQNSIRDKLTEIRGGLSNWSDASFPPSYIKAMEEMNLYKDTGIRLKDQIDGAVNKNQITLGEAASKIKAISKIVKEDELKVNALLEGLSYFRFSENGLRPGEFEIGITIPRVAIRNEAKELGAELVKLNRLFGVFSEIYVGSRENFQLRSISTSDPTVYLHSLPAVAAAVAVAIERTVALYGQIVSIRKTHAELRAASVPKTVLDGLQAHIEKTIKEGLEDYAKTVEAQKFKSIDSTRKSELGQELRKALGEIADRLDSGYEFDVRGKAPEADAPDEDNEERAAIRSDLVDYLRIVNESRGRIQSFSAEGEPILRISKDNTDKDVDD